MCAMVTSANLFPQRAHQADMLCFLLAVHDQGPHCFTKQDHRLGRCAQLSCETLESTWPSSGSDLIIQPCALTVLSVNNGLQSRNCMREMKEGELAFFLRQYRQDAWRGRTHEGTAGQRFF